ncbi:MAG: cytochrome c-type biogenesis protein [Sphingomonadales bacterium]|jgi:cytochrome c-type biogenesis protein CcmH
MMVNRSLIYILFLLTLLTSNLASAFIVDQPLAELELENKARKIMKGIRCLVCQNQSIEISDAELAQDLRLIIRERVLLGEGEKKIHNFLVSRYGDWVLMNPPLKPRTLLLWFAPLLILLIGGLAIYFFSRKKTIKIPPLSKEENKILKEILKKAVKK